MSGLRRRQRGRGFTIVELLVALVAGLLVTIAAFSFAKVATTSFQQESRVSGANVTGSLGFRRLVTDIQRASYMSTPNIRRDFLHDGIQGTVCVDPTAAVSGISHLTGITLEQSGYGSTGANSPISAPNATAPDRLTISGNFANTEQYAALSIDGAATVILLDPATGAVARTNASLAQQGGTWANVFRPGVIVRVVDRSGFQHFSTVASATTDPANNNAPKITLNTALYRQGGVATGGLNPTCTGVTGNGVGVLVNVVNRVRYEVRDLTADTNYASLYAAQSYGLGTTAASVTGDDNRFELVRYELAADDTIVPNTTELVAEYAVDLRFGANVATAVVNGAGKPYPTLTRFPIAGNDVLYTQWGRVPADNTQPGPERIRTVTARLSVRLREPDRTTAIDATLPGLTPGTLYRYKMPDGRYARVRNFEGDVSLPNQAEVFY